MATPPKSPPPSTGVGGGSFLKKKIGPIPLPLAVAIVAVVGYVLYRRSKSNTTATTATGTPQQLDPAASVAGPPSTGGAGTDGVGGGGLTASDLAQLLASGGLGTTNYYYGAGTPDPTFTNTAGPGNGTISSSLPGVTASSSAPESVDATGGMAGPAASVQPFAAPIIASEEAVKSQTTAASSSAIGSAQKAATEAGANIGTVGTQALDLFQFGVPTAPAQTPKAATQPKAQTKPDSFAGSASKAGANNPKTHT